MSGPKGQNVLRVLEDTGTLVQFPSPYITTPQLQLTMLQLQGPVFYAGTLPGYWTLPDISLPPETLAGKDCIGRFIRIHNGSAQSLNLQCGGAQTFGRGTNIEAMTIAAGGSVELFAHLDPTTGLYFWQPISYISVTLASAGTIMPQPASISIAGQTPTRTP